MRSRVIVGSGAIAHRQGEHDLVVRASATGEVRVSVSVPADETFVGATLDGERLVYVVETADKRSVVTELDAGGRTAWRRETPNAVGSPAARGGLVALPFAHQNLALLDGQNGHELGRVRATDEEIAYARALPEGIYYGGARGIYRLDDKSAAGSRAGSSYVEAKLPGEQVRTAYHWDGYQPAQSAIGAFDRNRLLWRGRDAGARVQATTSRSCTATASSSPSTRRRASCAGSTPIRAPTWWRRRTRARRSCSPRPTATSGSSIRPRARCAWCQRTGLRVAGASFDADGVTAGAGAQPPTEEEVAKTLEQIVWDHDARFAAVKVFAVDALGGVPGLPVSRALLKIVRAAPGPGGPPPAAQAARGRGAGGAQGSRGGAAHARGARRALRLPRGQGAARRGRDGARSRRARRQGGGAAPRRALWRITRRRRSTLKHVAETLAHLGGPDAEHALREFLLEYHADPTFLLDPAPLNAAGEALVERRRRGAARGRLRRRRQAHAAAGGAPAARRARRRGGEGKRRTGQEGQGGQEGRPRGRSRKAGMSCYNRHGARAEKVHDPGLPRARVRRQAPFRRRPRRVQARSVDRRRSAATRSSSTSTAASASASAA